MPNHIITLELDEASGERLVAVWREIGEWLATTPWALRERITKVMEDSDEPVAVQDGVVSSENDVHVISLRPGPAVVELLDLLRLGDSDALVAFADRQELDTRARRRARIARAFVKDPHAYDPEGRTGDV